MTQIKEFNNLDLMQTVRNNHLNPLIRRIESDIGPKVEKLEHEMQSTFVDVNLNETNKILTFTRGLGGGSQQIELDSIMPTFDGIGVEDESGTGPSSGINVIQLKDASVSRSGETAVVEYDWSKIVGAHAKPLQVGTIMGGNKPTNYLFFKGAEVIYSGTDIATVNIPTPPSQIMASIPSKPAFQTPVPITEIEIEGDVDSTNIVGTKLIINMNDKGGGITPLSADNFKGFYASLGDLKAKVTDPVNGKSYAFAQGSILSESYYIPYFYINDQWRQLNQEPALTYKGPGEPFQQGVLSIKPSEKIVVNDKGELNLDGLSTPQLPSHFKGFFTTLEELKADVPNPVVNQDWAYVRNSATGGLLAYRAGRNGTAVMWSVIAPLGSIAVVNRKDDPNHYAQAFGIYKNDSWTIDDKGLLELKPIDTTTEIIISDYQAQTTGGKINQIKFVDGKSMVEIVDKELVVSHPQQVITYNGTWEQAHASQDYRGNIFFDTTSRTWMGWADPEQQGAVGAKWTRIAHADMSLEVKDLTKRVPAKAPTVEPGILGDSRKWDYNGVTFMEKDDTYLPDELENKCGGYITTSVQDKDASGVTIPQYRIQTLVADRAEGGTFVRRFNGTTTPGSDTRWSPWVRTSFSQKDMDNHNLDGGAHNSTFKYYRASSFSAKVTSFIQQVEGDTIGGVRAENCDLMFDSHSSVLLGQDYMDVPYKGKFRVKGNLAFAGYKDGAKTFPLGRWQALVRVKKKDASAWRPMGQFTYDHTDKNSKFPIIDFETNETELDVDDRVIINITFSDMTTLAKDHPDLYFAPIKSYLLIEDTRTHTGFYMAKTYSKHFSPVDAHGAVGIRVHHSNLSDPNSNIRVYGEKINKVPVEMKKI